MVGATVKAMPLLAVPETVTTMLPVVAPVGTVTVMLVALQALAAPADIPLKVTVLLPCVAPKFVPVMVIDPPTAPDVWLTLVIAGVIAVVPGPFVLELVAAGLFEHPASPTSKAVTRSRIQSLPCTASFELYLPRRSERDALSAEPLRHRGTR